VVLLTVAFYGFAYLQQPAMHFSLNRCNKHICMYSYSTIVLTLLQTLCMELGLACILLSDTAVLIGSIVYFFVCSQLALAVVNFYNK